MQNACYKTKNQKKYTTPFQLDHIQVNITIPIKGLPVIYQALGWDSLKFYTKNLIPKIINKENKTLLTQNIITFRETYLKAPNYPTLSIMFNGKFFKNKHWWSGFLDFKRIWSEIEDTILARATQHQPILLKNKLVCKPTFKISRIDICKDFYNIPLTSFKFNKPRKQKDEPETKMVYINGEKTKIPYKRTPMNMRADQYGYPTQYNFGTRENAWIVFRAYDKGLEQKSTKYNHWIRLEWEFKKDRIKSLGFNEPKNFINGMTSKFALDTLKKHGRLFMDGYPTGKNMHTSIYRYRTFNLGKKLFAPKPQKIHELIKTQGNQFLTKIDEVPIQVKLYNPFSSIIGLLKNHGENLSKEQKETIQHRLNIS